MLSSITSISQVREEMERTKQCSGLMRVRTLVAGEWSGALMRSCSWVVAENHTSSVTFRW